MTDPLLVGEVRKILTRAGLPHADDTHFVIAGTGGEQSVITGCCDSLDEVIGLLSAALAAVTGGHPLNPQSGSVIVFREDLLTLLRRSGAVPGDVRARLADAAGVK